MVTNAILGSSDAQLNILILPSPEEMKKLFERLCKGVISLKTDRESVENFCESMSKIFKEVSRDRLPLLTESFERA